MIALEKLKLLVNMARVDGNLAPDERKFIKNIGIAHGYPESSVETLFYEDHEVTIPSTLTSDQRFNYASSLTQLMLLDKKMYLKEIEFCSDIIEKLGYEKRFVYKLIDAVGEQETNPQQLKILRDDADKFLKSEK